MLGADIGRQRAGWGDDEREARRRRACLHARESVPSDSEVLDYIDGSVLSV
jgi:hypothetical protein